MKRDFDTAAKTWDANAERVRMSETIAAAMRVALDCSGTETLLDYGTGTGTVALGLHPFVKRVVAADASRGMLDVLNAKISTLGLDLEHDGALPEGIRPDVIVSAMTLHHISDTARFVALLHASLPLGGKVAIADLDTEDGDFHSDNTGVEHFGFDRGALMQLFFAKGFGS